MKEKIRVNIIGSFWTVGWLFTIGFLKLNFLKALLGIFIWAWYLGKALGGF